MFNGYKKDIAAAAPKIEELQEGYPTEGSPSLGIPATQPGAAWFHMITTELLNVIKELGVLPDKNSLNQLATAILTLKFPTGTAFEYLRDKNYSKNDIVFTDERLYLCMANNGPASSVVKPGTNDSVWQKIPLKQDVLALVPDATTSVKGIVQLSDNITADASSITKAVTPHAIVQQNYAKSINGVKPDTSGNVSITRVDSAASADTAKSATKATNADKATHASTADSATKATNADKATHASTADSATKATNADKATHASTADSATKATQDSAGQQINSTYIKSLSVNGRTITYTKGNGSTGTITTQDTNTTYSKLSQFTNDSGYITDGHNFSSGVTVNGYKITVG
jgi:hypothetical protein